MSIEEFGFGVNDQDIQQGNKRFKAKKGEVYRLSLAYWPEKDGDLDLSYQTPLFKKCRRIYHPDLGYVLDKGPEYQKLTGGEPGKLSIGTVVVQWPLKPDYSVDREALKAGRFFVMPWTFSKTKLDEMGSKHRKRHLGSHDLEITCEEEQYQKLVFDTFQDSLLQKCLKDPKSPLREKLLSQIRAAVSNLDNVMARDLTLDQIRAKLTGEPVTPDLSALKSTETDEDIDSFLED